MDDPVRISPDSSTHNTRKAKKRKSKDHKRSKKKRKLKHADRSPPSPKLNIPELVGCPDKDLPVHLRGVELDVKPLGEYLHDKEELHKQLFKLINKKKFKQLLTSTLSKHDAKDVRSWCLDELESMSHKRICHVLNGTEMVSSSSSEDDAPDPRDEEGTPPEPGAISSMESVSTVAGGAEVAEVTSKPESNGPLSILDELSISPQREEIDALLEDEEGPAGKQNNADEHPTPADATGNTMDEEERTLAFLEMELRARALQSLLQRKE